MHNPMSMGKRSLGFVLGLIALSVACSDPPEQKAGPGGPGGFGDVDPNDRSCEVDSQPASIAPINLVFLLDRSGSMGNDTEWSFLLTKWQPTVRGLASFFSDPGTKGIQASLFAFPFGNLAVSAQCEPATYATPIVGATDLPSPAFDAQLNSNAPVQRDSVIDPSYPALWPENGGQTPTATAFIEAHKFAKAGLTPGRRTAIVLVTDGLPQDGDCSAANTIEMTKSAVQAAAADGVLTFVLGVKDPNDPSSLAQLGELAVAGGTKDAIFLDTGDAARTVSDMLKAVNDIRSSVQPCEFDIPSDTFDARKVNVALNEEILGQNQGCDGGEGWQYDQPEQPKKVLLCPSSCEVGQRGSIRVQFGCDTVSIK